MINTIWSIIAGICLTLAVLHLFVWIRSRRSWANLIFAIAAFGGAAMAVGELHMMRSPSPAAYGQAIRLLHIPVGMVVVSLVWFIRFYLRAGRTWLAWTITAMRVLVLVLTFTLTPNLNFRSITALREFHAWGETIVVAVGEKNPWTNITHLSALLLLAFVADAAIAAWRRGNRQRAAVIGLSFCSAIAASLILSELFNRGILPMPLALSPLFLIIMLGIAFELANDLVRKHQLADELEESRQRMTLAAEAADLGMWEWDISRDEFWANEVTRHRIGAHSAESLSLNRILEAVDPRDRAGIRRNIDEAISCGGDFEFEYRTTDHTGSTRWLIARGKVEKADDGAPLRLRGVTIDVTRRHAAEAAALEVGGRLINAQEDESRRIARELHDSVNQQLALLALQFDTLRKQKTSGAQDAATLEEISGRLKQVSSEIHALSTQLHPAKLDQIGLETSSRVLCRDLSLRTGVAIEFTARDVPSRLAGSAALGVFRILQESLANVIKHSGSTAAEVRLEGGPDGLHLTVRDSGCGFDPDSPVHQAGLGLVSMRERARLMDGQLEIRSSPGSGTFLELNVKLPPPGDSTPT